MFNDDDDDVDQFSDIYIPNQVAHIQQNVVIV